MYEVFLSFICPFHQVLSQMKVVRKLTHPVHDNYRSSNRPIQSQKCQGELSYRYNKSLGNSLRAGIYHTSKTRLSRMNRGTSLPLWELARIQPERKRTKDNTISLFLNFVETGDQKVQVCVTIKDGGLRSVPAPTPWLRFRLRLQLPKNSWLWFRLQLPKNNFLGPS